MEMEFILVRKKKTMAKLHEKPKVFFLERHRRAACHFIKKITTEERQSLLPQEPITGLLAPHIKK